MIPSIDLLDGKVVILKQGKEKVFEAKESPIEIAVKLSRFPIVQVIDLNAAFGKGNNTKIVKEICKRLNARVGGGVRSMKKAKQAFANGASKIIIGTRAEKSFLSGLCKEFGKERTIAAIDSYNGKLVVEGWQKESRENIVAKVKALEPYCSEFLFSVVEKDGTLSGINVEAIKELKRLTSNKISIAGGVSTEKEILELNNIGIDCVVGLALYTKKIGGLE